VSHVGEGCRDFKLLMFQLNFFYLLTLVSHLNVGRRVEVVALSRVVRETDGDRPSLDLLRKNVLLVQKQDHRSLINENDLSSKLLYI